MKFSIFIGILSQYVSFETQLTPLATSRYPGRALGKPIGGSVHTTNFRAKALLTLLGLTMMSCQTKTPDQYFLLGSDFERFSLGSRTTREVEVRQYPKIDLLWVVDNSGSMADNQNRLTAAFDEFSIKYLRDGRMDLRTAVIPTDLYLGGSGTRPVNYAMMSSGCHDGQRPPCSGGARSGRPILTTRLSDGSSPNVSDSAFFDLLVSHFKMNAKPGTSGHGDESATAAMVDFLRKNEPNSRCGVDRSDPSCLFRRDSVRVVIPFSDAIDNCSPAAGGLGPCFSAAGRAASTKAELDQFFTNVDGKTNYFMVGIRSYEDSSNNGNQMEYDALANALRADTSNPRSQLSKVVGMNQPLNEVLEDIGSTLGTIYETDIQIVAEYQLRQVVNPSIPIEVTVVSQGVVNLISPSKYQVTGNFLQIDPAALAGFQPEDELHVEYIRGPS
jgi:hypothetical protein